MTKRTIFYTTDYSEVPLIKLRYKDTEFYAILDSGSEATLIDRQFAEKLGLEPSETDISVSYTGFGGVSDVPLSNVSVKCFATDDIFPQYPMTIDATLSDLSAIQLHFDKWNDEKILVPVLIGIDTLTKIEATINFEDKLFSFYGEKDEQDK
jgi:hypothetical protein